MKIFQKDDVYYDGKLLQDVWLTVKEMCIETEVE